MEPFLISMIIAATPFLFAGMGELVAERSGVLNLGVEGMMLMGAVTAFAVAWSTGNSMLAILAGAGAGAAMAFIFAFIALSLLANQAATGLALLFWRHTSAMGWLLAIHLGFVLALFVTLPYGKMVHGVYRLAALVRSHAERQAD